MDIVSRLKRYMDYHQIPVTQFADTCRIPRPTMSQLLNGRNKKVSDEVISKIHDAYPRLSVLWLMFGEGSMETAGNIEMSEPQNLQIEASTDNQTLDSQAEAPRFDFENDFTDDNLKNFGVDNPGRTAAFAAPAAPRQNENQATIKFGDKGKRVISIVVYYDDNSYESFVPDPTGRSPFAR